MKCFNLLLLTILAVAGASAQVPTDSSPPGLVVGDISWRKEAFVPALYEDPLSRNQEHADLEREQKQTIRQNVIRVQSGQLPLPLPTTPASTTRPKLSSVYYRYEAKIKNTGTKTVRQVTWEYFLLEPETEFEIGRHEYISKVNLRFGKGTTVVGISDTPPNGVVSVTKSGQEVRNKFVERVVINRIEYDDGTVWQRPLK